MLALRIIAQVLAVGFPLLAGLLDYHWRDKRTRKFRRVKFSLFVVGTLLLIVSVYLTILDQDAHERESSALRSSIQRLAANGSQQAIQAEQRDRTTQARLRQLLDSNHAFETQLAPFVREADRRFPSLPSQSRLERLAQEVALQQTQLDAIRNYSEIAKLNFAGVTGVAQPPLVESTPISRLLEGTYAIEGNHLTYGCSDSAAARFHRVVTEFPRFPFANYALAFCAQRQGNAAWREYAKKAQAILLRTTIIDGHHPNHDLALREIEAALRR